MPKLIFLFATFKYLSHIVNIVNHSLTSATDLIEVLDLSDVTRHLLVCGVDPPDHAVRGSVEVLSGPVNGEQEELSHRDGDDDVQLSIVKHHLGPEIEA